MGVSTLWEFFFFFFGWRVYGFVGLFLYTFSMAHTRHAL